MKSWIRKYLVLLVGINGIGFSASATHIMGGDLTYEYLSPSTYRITFFYYIDCVNGNSSAISSDKFAIFGFFNAKSKNFISKDEIQWSDEVLVTELNYACVDAKPNACVRKYSFSFVKQIDPGNDGVIVSFQRCCRNKTIGNIFDPEAAGMTIFAVIPPKNIVNSSPVFKNLPPNFLCNDLELKFDHSAVDKDGDSLSYSLYLPYIGATASVPRPSQPSNPPYTELVYVSPYNLTNMMGGTEKLKIDETTGELTVKPDQVGQFVVGIMVSEFRNGVKVGETLRDYQFNVLDCKITVKAKFSIPEITCDMREIHFVESTNDTTQMYKWNFGTGLSEDTSNKLSPSFTYSQKGTYVVKLKVQKGKCSDSTTKTITIGDVDSVYARFSVMPDTICEGSSIAIANFSSSTTDWWWDTGDNSPLRHNTELIAHTYDRPGTYRLQLSILDAKNCDASDTAEKWITVLPIDTISTEFTYEFTDGCDPLTVDLKKTSSGMKNWYWQIEFDSNTFTNEELISYSFGNSGQYRISLIAEKDAKGCITYVPISQVIEVVHQVRIAPDLIIPNVFTPDGDSFNECYELVGDEVSCGKVIYLIYNRWGELLFNSELEGRCWTGNVAKSGRELPSGTYFAIVTVYDRNNDVVDSSSHAITLIR